MLIWGTHVLEHMIISWSPLCHLSWQCLHYITVFALVQHSLTISSCERAHCHFRGVKPQAGSISRRRHFLHIHHQPSPLDCQSLLIYFVLLKNPLFTTAAKNQGHHCTYLLLNSNLVIKTYCSLIKAVGAPLQQWSGDTLSSGAQDMTGWLSLGQIVSWWLKAAFVWSPIKCFRSFFNHTMTRPFEAKSSTFCNMRQCKSCKQINYFCFRRRRI